MIRRSIMALSYTVDIKRIYFCQLILKERYYYESIREIKIVKYSIFHV